MIAYGPYLPTWTSRLAPEITLEQDVPTDQGEPDIFCIYEGEGMNESVVVTKLRSGVVNFHSTGKVQASSHPDDMRLQRMLGHIPALAIGNPKTALVIGCGAGVTAGTFVLYPSIQRIVICDIERLVPACVAPKFAKENYGVVTDPRTEVVSDDGRHFIHTTREKFDIITSDPIDPWMKGCAALYSEEFYAMCREHLNPGGIVTIWLPFYNSDPETVKSLVATFFKVFPEGTIWCNNSEGKGYDAVLLGQAGPSHIDMQEMQARLADEDFAPVAQSLDQVGFPSAVDLFATYAGDAPHLQKWLAGAQINSDRNLRLQYLAGMGVNFTLSGEIVADMFQYRAYPEELFSGPVDTIQQLRDKIESKPNE
jgi:spermidine synthase